MAKDMKASAAQTVGNVFGGMANRLGPGVRSTMARLGALDPERIPLLNRLTQDQRQPALVVVLLIWCWRPDF